jgi:hypothetical protein
MQGNKMNGGWMDGWLGKGGWANGQILILSKQEDKENKWKVDEKRNSECPIRPMQWMNKEMAASVHMYD